MNFTEKDLLYSPSHWSKRSDVINAHVNFLTNVSANNKSDIPCLLNIPYGNKVTQKYDLYGTDLLKDASIFIFIHGGYWQELSRDISGYVAAPFYKNKIKTIVIGYTLCPHTTVKEIGEEIKLATRKCINYAKENGVKNIYISGYSAGTQLICNLFTDFYQTLNQEEKSLIKSTILCCGVYDLTPLVETYLNIPLKLTFDDAKEISPMYHDLDVLDFNIYIVVGEYDSPAFKEQSKLYYEKIQTVCKNLNFKILPNIDHFNIVENYNCEDYELVKYILDIENSLNKNEKL